MDITTDSLDNIEAWVPVVGIENSSYALEIYQNNRCFYDSNESWIRTINELVRGGVQPSVDSAAPPAVDSDATSLLEVDYDEEPDVWPPAHTDDVVVFG